MCKTRGSLQPRLATRGEMIMLPGSGTGLDLGPNAGSAVHLFPIQGAFPEVTLIITLYKPHPSGTTDAALGPCIFLRRLTGNYDP